MRSPAGRGGGGLRRRLPGDGCSGGRRQRKGATTALPGRRRSRVTVAPGRPSRVRPRRADRPSQEVIDPGPTSRDEGDDAHRIRYRLDCRRSRSQGQRSFRVADRPFADTFGRASSRRSLAGQEQPPSCPKAGTAIRGTAAAREIGTRRRRDCSSDFVVWCRCQPAEPGPSLSGFCFRLTVAR